MHPHIKLKRNLSIFVICRGLTRIYLKSLTFMKKCNTIFKHNPDISLVIHFKPPTLKGPETNTTIEIKIPRMLSRIWKLLINVNTKKKNGFWLNPINWKQNEKLVFHSLTCSCSGKILATNFGSVVFPLPGGWFWSGWWGEGREEGGGGQVI